ncbi:hypothetical protein I4000191A8_26830 [Clostridia bacterium i40-0019-1A8]
MFYSLLHPLIILHTVLLGKPIIHGFGHALGLAHPTCGDKAIMWQTKDSDYVSHEITEHDEYNMIHKYEK